MDGFTYVNIFETKGIEYIAIITFFLVLVPFWYILKNRKAISKKINKAFSILTGKTLRIPKGVFHSKNHTWTYLEKSGAAKVGMDDFLVQTTGDIKLKGMKEAGQVIQKGDVMAELVKDENIIKIYAPITGKILKTNHKLNEKPELLNEDPYQLGWIYRIEPQAWKTETNAYLLADEAQAWANDEVTRLKDFLAESYSKQTSAENLVVLQDGGELSEDALSQFPPTIWQDFQKQFLNTDNK